MTELVEFAGRDGNRLAADATGDPADPPVVLLHGGGQTRHSWGTTLETLGDAGLARRTRSTCAATATASGLPTATTPSMRFAGDVLAITRDARRAACARRRVARRPRRRSRRSASTPTRTSPGRSSWSTSHRGSRRQGRDRIGAFMIEHMDEGFGSLDEVADAIQRYNPHRPRPTNLDGLEKNLRERDDGRWYWHWDPAFISGQLGGADETRSSLVDPDAAPGRGSARSRVPTLLVRGRVSDLLSEEGARELLRARAARPDGRRRRTPATWSPATATTSSTTPSSPSSTT